MPPLLFGGGGDASAANQTNIEAKIDIIDANVDTLVERAQCDVGMTPSTTTIDCADLAGYGDDYFNQNWMMCILYNADNPGAAPENEWRDITDYVGATGIFTVPAFSANVEENDYVLVARNEFIVKRTETFFSTSQITATIPAGAADIVLPSVVLPNIAGTIIQAKAGIKFRMVENTNVGANKLSGVQEIQVMESIGGAWIDAINLVDDMWSIAASTKEGGDVVMGNIDVIAQVSVFNKTYDFQMDEAVADLASIVLCDVQTFLIVVWI